MRMKQEIRKEALFLACQTALVFGIQLDFTDASVDKVEMILDRLSLKLKLDKNEGEARQLAFAFATYIIEVIERKYGKIGEWSNDEGQDSKKLPYIFTDGFTIFPFAWCMKRMIDGEQENLADKYRKLVRDRLSRMA